MITQHQCITITCDECGNDYETDDVTIHFPNLAAAAKHLEQAAWVVSSNRIICSHCALTAECALLGHKPMEHNGYRWCTRCNEDLTRDDQG